MILYNLKKGEVINHNECQIHKINANTLNVSFIKMLKNVGTFITQRHYNVPKNNKNASWNLVFSFIVFKKVSTHSQSLS
jgi:hypothetical protein